MNEQLEHRRHSVLIRYYYQSDWSIVSMNAAIETNGICCCFFFIEWDKRTQRINNTNPRDHKKNSSLQPKIEGENLKANNWSTV